MIERAISEEAAKLPPPFFVMGCEASGTNLMSLILDSHSQLAVCRGTHYYLLFRSERRFYGDLQRRSNLLPLIRDFAETIRSYGMDPPSIDEVLAALVDPSFEGVLAAFLNLYAVREGKARAGERSSKHYLYLEEILEGFPDSPVVFTMRDPRDLALAHRQGFGFSLESAVRSWKSAYECMCAAPRPVRLVRYEDVVREPERELQAVCDFLGHRYEPAMLQFYERTPRRFYSRPHHQRLFGALSPDSIGQFRELSGPEIARIEASCAEGMEALGYRPTSPRSTAPSVASPMQHPGPARFLADRLRYYGLNRSRWTRGLGRWKILLRARLRYALKLEFLRGRP